MSSDRDTYKYQFVGPDRRIKHSGITNDLERREGELHREYGQGDIRQVGHRTTREAAREWEKSRPTAGRSVPNRREPRWVPVLIHRPRGSPEPEESEGWYVWEIRLVAPDGEDHA